MTAFSEMYIQELKNVLDSFPHAQFDRFIRAMLDAYENQKQIFVMGNGGSASTASHWVCDINKGCCLEKENKFKMMCLNDNIASMMAYANDIAYEDVFVEQLKNFFQPGDVVIGISGSGNSENVIRAITHTKENGCLTVGLVGYAGGKLGQLVDILLLAPIHDMQKVEDMHMVMVHVSMQMIYKMINDDEGQGMIA